jgi:secreted trypsin-like serine protease
MRRWLTIPVGIMALALLPVTAAQGIIDGKADEGAHPYVGELLFYVPDEVDPRFEDPGSWFNCTGSLVDADTVVTAGHCTYAVGLEGASTTEGGGTGSGGTDVWINFAEAPDFSILPPSSSFAADENQERYDAWSSALDDSDEWVSATSIPHPQYDPSQFWVHDAGVLELDSDMAMTEYAELPAEGLLNTYAKDKKQLFTAVGYGVEGSKRAGTTGGDTRRRADLMLVNLQGAYGAGKGISAKFSNNNGRRHTGGTCFGDSGGPILVKGSDTLVAVTSFGLSVTCSDGTGGYRIDQPDDLGFISPFVSGP